MKQSSSPWTTNLVNPLLLQEKKALLLLSLFHLFIIAASNYLVQIPLTVDLSFIGGGNVETTWGSFTFPFIFLATDLTVRIFGAKLARKIIFLSMLPALVVSYLVSVLFYESQFQGFQALVHLNNFVFRIAFASFIAYCIGQLIDIYVFNRLRKLPQWYIAPSTSTIFGNALDALLFFFLAFYQCSDEFMAANWDKLAWVDYLTRLAISMLFFLPMYGLLINYLIKRLQKSN